jgi:hypothetical protein
MNIEVIIIIIILGWFLFSFAISLVCRGKLGRTFRQIYCHHKWIFIEERIDMGWITWFTGPRAIREYQCIECGKKMFERAKS